MSVALSRRCTGRFFFHFRQNHCQRAPLDSTTFPHEHHEKKATTAHFKTPEITDWSSIVALKLHGSSCREYEVIMHPVYAHSIPTGRTKGWSPLERIFFCRRGNVDKDRNVQMGPLLCFFREPMWESGGSQRHGQMMIRTLRLIFDEWA